MTIPADVLRNTVKEKLARNELVTFMIVRLVRSVEIAGIARTAGYDAIYIDLEHNSFSLETTGQICIACLPMAVTPFVRVPGLDPQLIARVLEAGALGVIVPHVQSRQDAEAVVQAAKYPPLGTRSLAGALPHMRFRTFPAVATMKAINDATMVVAMIESAEAVAAADEIAAVDGVDMLLIGTNDLSNALGIPGQLDHPSVREAYVRTFEACRKHNKHLGVGGLASKPELAKEFIELGARYISAGSDIAFLLAAAAEKVKQFK
jgi:2-keto-3-deoxy-L-rhamnonate aldolase RhmA